MYILSILLLAMATIVLAMTYEQATHELALGPHPTKHNVDSAYRRLSRQHHPDMGGNATRFITLTDARNTLLGVFSEPTSVEEPVRKTHRTARAPRRKTSHQFRNRSGKTREPAYKAHVDPNENLNNNL
jgi:hypothetical protein